MMWQRIIGWLTEARREGAEGAKPIALTKLVGEGLNHMVTTSHLSQSDVSLGEDGKDNLSVVCG